MVPIVQRLVLGAEGAPVERDGVRRRQVREVPATVDHAHARVRAADRLVVQLHVAVERPLAAAEGDVGAVGARGADESDLAAEVVAGDDLEAAGEELEGALDRKSVV